MTTRRQQFGMNAIAGLSLALAVGCATVPDVTASGASAPANLLDARSRRDRVTFTPADLARPTGGSTLDILRQLRPEFFIPSARAVGSHAPIALYVNNRYDGDVVGLNTIPVEEIKEISFLHPMEAISLFGTLCRCESGAILVKLKRPGRK